VSKPANISKTTCKFNNRKSGFFCKFGSAAIAVGSLATALSIAVQSVGVFVGKTAARRDRYSVECGQDRDDQF